MVWGCHVKKLSQKRTKTKEKHPSILFVIQLGVIDGMEAIQAVIGQESTPRTGH